MQVIMQKQDTKTKSIKGTHFDLRDGEFFFITGDKTPYRKTKLGYINLQERTYETFNDELPTKVRRIFKEDLMSKYNMSRFAFSLWMEHVDNKLKESE